MNVESFIHFEVSSWYHSNTKFAKITKSWYRLFLFQLMFVNFFKHPIRYFAFAIEHSDPKIAINFTSLYLEEFSGYWFDTLQEVLQYAEFEFYKFLIHFFLPSLKYLIGKNWNLARSECLMKVTEILRYNWSIQL